MPTQPEDTALAQVNGWDISRQPTPAGVLFVIDAAGLGFPTLDQACERARALPAA
jgi:hypothetical protein